jgi:tetratricopeptide (TPR) repeat protein
MKPKKGQGDWRPLTKEGVSLLRQGRPQQALTLLMRARRLAPDERDVSYWLANACRMTGETGRSEDIFRELLTKRPDDFEASFGLAFLLREVGHPAPAADALLTASKQPGVGIEQLLQIAEFLRDNGQFVAAIEVRERAVKLRPKQADLHYDLGKLYQATGAFEQALEAFKKTLDLKPAMGPAWTAIAQQHNFRSTDDAIYTRIQAEAARSHDPETDMCIAFAFGKALDDLQQCSRAWEQYEKGNILASKAMPWTPSTWSNFVDRSIAANTGAESASNGVDRNAIFIVGMPRSGTTLLEQLLDRHPDISGRGELNFLDHLAKQRATSSGLTGTQRQEAADLLWTQMRLGGAEDGAYVDKNPLNFRYLDLLFALLPTAKVLHVMRDSRDTCLSCYFQLFQHPDLAFSNALDGLVAFYAGYQRIMAHWETIYGDRIHRVRYEDLVRNSDRELASALGFIGMEWDDAMTQGMEKGRVVRTASVYQARQPIHSRSLARWRPYEKHAPEFFSRLAAIESGCEANGD